MIGIYSKDLTRQEFVLNVISFSCNERYNEIGTFTLITGSSYSSQLLKIGSIIRDGNFFGIIERIKFSNDEITINGYTLNWLLKTRVIMNDLSVSGNLEQSIYNTVSSNLRGLGLSLSPLKGFTDTFSTKFDAGTNLADLVVTLCNHCDYGNRITINPNTGIYTFEIYQGEDLSLNSNPRAVLFSAERKNLGELVGDSDYSNRANKIFVTAKNLTKERVMVVVDDSSDDENVVETFLSGSDQRDIETEYDDEGREIGTIPAETTEEFLSRLEQDGRAELKENHSLHQSFTFTINPSEYGIKYSLGDKVSCSSSKFDLKFVTRVTGVKHSLETSGETYTITLGSLSLRRAK